jgi:hypothetical protein
VFRRRYASYPAATPAPAQREWRAGRPAPQAGAQPTPTARVAGLLAEGGVVVVRVVEILAAVVVGLIALAIVLILLDASIRNTLVFHVRDWAHTLAAPFLGIFHLRSAKATSVVNYGIAAIVYAIVGRAIVGLVASAFAPARRRVPA